MSPEEKENIGIIAGGGLFPLMVADAAREQGHRVVAIAHHEETDPALADKVDHIVWINLGQMGELIEGLKSQGVEKALMAGTINKRLMFKLKPDLKGLALMSKLAIFHDDGILRSLAKELKKDGIEIVGATSFLPELFSWEGWILGSVSWLEEKRFWPWRPWRGRTRLFSGEEGLQRKRPL
jgi:DUF1009 family protein